MKLKKVLKEKYMRIKMDDLIKLLKNKKYNINIETIQFLNNCFGEGNYDNVEQIIDKIENTIIVLQSIKEGIERENEN